MLALRNEPVVHSKRQVIAKRVDPCSSDSFFLHEPCISYKQSINVFVFLYLVNSRITFVSFPVHFLIVDSSCV